MRVSKRAPQRILVARNGDKVNMIRHHAVRPDAEVMLREIVGHRLPVCEPIRIVYEDHIAPVPALRDMMRQPRNHHARQPAHTLPIYPTSLILQ